MTPEGNAAPTLVTRLTDRLPSMLAYWDRDLRCQYANPAYETWFGVSPERLIGRGIQGLLGPELFELNRPHIEAALHGEAQVFERTLRCSDGAVRDSLAHYIPDVDGDQVCGFIVQVTDVTPVKRPDGLAGGQVPQRSSDLRPCEPGDVPRRVIAARVRGVVQGVLHATHLLRRDGSARSTEKCVAVIESACERIAELLEPFETPRAASVPRTRRVAPAQLDLLASIAHELRNSLAPVSNAVDVIGLREGAQGANEQTLAMMRRQLERVSALLDDLMEGASLHAAEASTLPSHPVPLAAVVDDALEMVAHLMLAKQVSHRVDMPDVGVCVLGDRRRLVQALANLLGNAVRYSNRAGEIRIAVYGDDSLARIRVADDGAGMTQAIQGRIFDMFVRADPSEHGFGIGLAIVRRVAELHGGAVRGHSPGPGLGSTFEIVLPLLQAP